MLQVHEERDASVIVCKEFPPDQIGLYGAVDYERAGERLLKIKSLIEKPAPGEAPSSYAVLGRYVFTPGIFDALDQVKPGRGGEIQLTHAIGLLLETEDVYGYTFVAGRYDVRTTLAYSRATVEQDLPHPELRPTT